MSSVERNCYIPLPKQSRRKSTFQKCCFWARILLLCKQSLFYSFCLECRSFTKSCLDLFLNINKIITVDYVCYTNSRNQWHRHFWFHKFFAMLILASHKPPYLWNTNTKKYAILIFSPMCQVKISWFFFIFIFINIFSDRVSKPT